MATIAIALSLAKEIGDFSTVGFNRIYSNKRSKEKKCNNSMFESVDSVCTTT